jgi:site-specific recombinase XerD
MGTALQLKLLSQSALWEPISFFTSNQIGKARSVPDLRYAFATPLLESGTAIKYTQELLSDLT